MDPSLTKKKLKWTRRFWMGSFPIERGLPSTLGLKPKPETKTKQKIQAELQSIFSRVNNFPSESRFEN